MDGTIIGLVAVIMSLGIPLGAMYTYFRVKKLRTEERLAAIARGVSVPLEPELSQAARRAGIHCANRARTRNLDRRRPRLHPSGHRHRLLHRLHADPPRPASLLVLECKGRA